MYPRQSRAQAFHSVGEVIMDFPAASELRIATVSPQGLKLLLMGIGKSKLVQQKVQAMWTTQMEQTALGTERKLVLYVSDQ